jgi:hypothetical protein
MVEDTLNYGLSTVAEQTALPFGLILYNSNSLTNYRICTLLFEFGFHRPLG